MSTRRISVWSPKGGTGKTTLALSLSGALAERGQRVVLVDADPQSASLLWARLAQNAERATAFVVAGGLPRRQGDFDWVVFDHGPGVRQMAPPGEVVVVPALADAASCLTVDAVVPGLRRAGKRLIVVVNRWRPDRREHTRVVAMLDAPVVVRDRAVFATAFGRGATVHDTDAGLLQARPARRDIDALLERVLREH